MNLKNLTLPLGFLITVISLNACSLQTEYVQSYRQFDLVNQEITGKQQIIEKIEAYIQSCKDILNQSKNTQSKKVNGNNYSIQQVLINIQQAEKSFNEFKIQIDQLKLKQQYLRQYINRNHDGNSNLI